MSLDDRLAIRVNGERRQMPAGLSVAEMVIELGLDPSRVAIERNLKIVPRSQLRQALVEEGDEFEIVHIVGGG